MDAILILIFLVSFQRQPTGTISGRVTFEDSGAAATDVVVHCVARGGSPTEQVTTDVDGRFLCRVAPGVYRVRAQLSRLDTLYLPEVYGAREAGDEGLGLRVREHAKVEVPLVLRKSGTISGRVLDEEGLPLRGAIVTAFRESSDRPSLGVRPMETAAVGDRGGFSIGGWSLGVYRIRVAPPERAATSDKDGRRLVPTWYPAVTDPRHAIPMQINDDDLAGVDLVLGRSRMLVVSGVVRRADGSPAAGIEVRLVAQVEDYAISSSPVTTGVKGAFTFRAVEPGSYQLAASVSGDPPEMANAPTVIGDLDVTDLVLSLRRSSAVRGRIRWEGESNPGASLSVDARGFDRFAVVSRTTTDAKRGFVLTPSNGARLLRVGGLPKGWWLKSVTAAGRDITNEPVDMTDGLDVEILVSRRMGMLSGVVKDIDAQPRNSLLTPRCSSSAMTHRSGLPRQRQSRACGRTRGGSLRLKAFRPVPIGSLRSIRRLPVFCRRFPTSCAR